MPIRDDLCEVCKKPTDGGSRRIIDIDCFTTQLCKNCAEQGVVPYELLVHWLIIELRTKKFQNMDHFKKFLATKVIFSPHTWNAPANVPRILYIYHKQLFELLDEINLIIPRDIYSDWERQWLE